uniref:Uncharacterized protein n=1 Tax=Arundo donax TaxID=35708 RepID=A0A0A9D7B0_ARUDO
MKQNLSESIKTRCKNHAKLLFKWDWTVQIVYGVMGIYFLTASAFTFSLFSQVQKH